eukprot:gnl/TRDRNA2_/TRDRNA2_197225_c0_seq1.p1 gnl/TRDRNA2_/TRDRNA2_197225_c0~~gnl/TRDRNA2_/TRDRNA2_197225_c0_seq1.p1  ORF type:complete len:364 (-),score=57.27 gnl/TRDRNA2_/TRDRNA2_197225_c0_seq1:54-1145(-)
MAPAADVLSAAVGHWGSTSAPMTRTSWLDPAKLICPGDAGAVRRAPVPAPACVDNNQDCTEPSSLSQLRTWLTSVDTALEDQLKAVTAARKRFQTRACAYRYAQAEEKPESLIEAYGPNGPLAPGGSYIYEMRQWSDAVHALNRACNRDPACQDVIDMLRKAPEATRNIGGSKVFAELSAACEVGDSRSPVPNDEPVWCDKTTGLCEQKSCRDWWNLRYGKESPWKDDRIAYDDLKDACAWVKKAERPKPETLNAMQYHLQDDARKLKEQYCSPKWVEGYCGNHKKKQKFSECQLEGMKYCKHGRLLSDETAVQSSKDIGWKEPFAEPEVSQAPWWMMPPAPILPSATRRGARPPSHELRAFL